MPGTDSYGQNVPYPKLSDQPNAETAFGTLVNAIVPLTNMVFANANARAAAIPNPVVGMETYLIAEGRKDYFDGTSWQAITPGVWHPLTFATGYSARSGSPSIRVENDIVQLRGTVGRTNGAPFTVLTQLVIIDNLPAAFRPSSTRWFAAPTEWVASLYGRIEVNPDGTVHAIIPDQTGTAPSWIGLDGITYSLS